MTTLQVTRANELQNRFRKYKIYIDNEVAGVIASGETKEFLLTGGTHTVKAKMGWYGSQEAIIDTNNGEMQYLKVSGNPVMQWLSILIILPAIFVRIFAKDKLTDGNIYLLFAALVILLAIFMFTLGRKRYLILRSF
jgi:hypothetical protein